MALNWTGGCGQGGGSYIPGDGINITNNTISAVRNASNTYTKEEVDALFGNLEHARMEEVSSLPATGETNIIYLVPKSGGGHDMYIWDAVNEQYVPVGQDTIDLAGYVQETQLGTLAVTGVKGNAETAYRKGNVNLTPANIGAVNRAGDTMTGNLTVSNAGTADTTGQSYLMAGNNIASGVDGNSKGFVRVYSNSTGFTQISSVNENTGMHNQYLQAAGGTIALTSNIPGVATASTPGLMSAAQYSKLTRIGNSVGATVITNTLANATATNIRSLTLPSGGTYLVIGRVQFPSNATGYRAVGINTVATSLGLLVIVPAANGIVTCLETTFVVSGGSTVYLTASQNSGSSMTLSNVVNLNAYCIS